MVLKNVILSAILASTLFTTVSYGAEIENTSAVEEVASVKDDENAIEENNLAQSEDKEISSKDNDEEAVVEGTDFSDYFIISHACGTVDSRSETNSLEAFLQNYENGQRVFEIDFSLTSDNKLVARHDFEQNSYYVLEQSYNKNAPVMTHMQFMSTPINYKYTPMDADTVAELLNTYKDAYIVTDSKNTDKASIEKEFKLLKEAVEKTGNKEIFDRIIVQIYYPEMQVYVRNIGGFKNYMLTTYQIQNPNYEELAEYCSKNDIGAMVLPKEIVTQNIVNTIHSKGIKAYTHTINRLSEIKQFIDVYGIDGVYSDYIIESDMEYIKK